MAKGNAFLAVTATAAFAAAQAPGLRLIQPLGLERTSLVDETGAVVHTWPGSDNVSAHLAPDGSLLRGAATGGITIGGGTGRLQRLAFDGSVRWDMLFNGPTHYMHHDIEPLPNGNVLIIVWDGSSAATAIANGRDPALLTSNIWYPDALLEVRQTGPTSGAIVWEWHVMDHVIQDHDSTKANFGAVASHPELVDINYPAVPLANGDWNHVNGIDYDPVNDWIVVSAREQGEFWIIDHSTTTAEAAGHSGGQRGRGGDILYRWGNPEAYRAGAAADRYLVGAHDARFIPPGYPGAGNVTVFNNDDTLLAQSAVAEVVLPVIGGGFQVDPATGRYGPAGPVWEYTEEPFYSRFISSAERLPNGNTLICSGQQFEIFEVDPAGQRVWSYTYPPTDPMSVGVFQAHFVERALWIDTPALSVGGGQVKFDHLVGSNSAGNLVFLLGAVGGTTPGTLLPAGVLVPLNFDFFTAMIASNPNSGLFVDMLTNLDSHGAAQSSVVVPGGLIPAGLIGARFNFAHVVFDSALLPTRASNPAAFFIVP